MEKVLFNRTCPHCGNKLPSDSEFCQFCGKRIAKEASFENKIKLPDVLLTDIEINEIKGDTPVIVKKASIFSTADKEECYLRCVFTSVAQKAVSALLLDIICYDVWGTELAVERSIQILDLSASRKEEFGSDTKIRLSSKETRFVKLDLKRVRFTDGTIHECTGDINKLMPQKGLGEFFDSDDYVQQYIRETSQESVSMPTQYDAFWQCACGELNSNAEFACNKCGVSKQKIFGATDKTFLSDRIADYRKQQEEKKQAAALEQQRIEIERREKIWQLKNDVIDKRFDLAQKEEKRRSKRKSIIVVAAVILGLLLLVFGIVYAGIKDKERSLQLQRAQELRNMAIDEMEDGFLNVYADVVSIKPQYYIYYYKTRNGVKVQGSESLSEVVCQCKTIEGKSIWVVIQCKDYPGKNNSLRESDYKDLYYSKNNPFRLTGEIDNTQEYLKDLNAKINDPYLLIVKKMEQQN